METVQAPSDLVHTMDEIERRLKLGLVPATDDRALLEAMRFERMYGDNIARDGYHERLWFRRVEVNSTRTGARSIALQRAVLYD